MRLLGSKGLVGVLSLLAALCGVLAGAGAAYGLSPWWHLSSGTRPSYLQPGKATDEVQEVRLSGGEGFYMLAARGGIGQGHFAFLSTEESAAEVQHQLENEVFEPGLVKGSTVKVTAAPAPPGGGKAYRVTFLGRYEAQWVATMEGRPVVAGDAPAVSVSEVTRGRPDGVVVVDATNLGDAGVDPAVAPVSVSDVLPPGVKPVAIEGVLDESLILLIGAEGAPRLSCSLEALSCTFTGKVPVGETHRPENYPASLPPYERIEVRIAVKVTGAQSDAVNEASISGGGAPAASVRRPLTVSSTPMPFGVNTYEMRAEEEGGGPATQAGSHPFQLTTTLAFNESIEGRPAAMAKDLHFDLPPGVIGNPEPFPRCTLAQFLSRSGQGENPGCPADTVVGVARISAHTFLREMVPEGGGSVIPVLPVATALYNLEPQAGEPARFGFMVKPPFENIPVYLDTAVRTGGDYGVTVNVSNITEEAEFLSSEVTFWGVPGDPRHNDARGVPCIGSELANSLGEGDLGYTCPAFESPSPPPLLSLPTSCTGPLLTAIEADSWADVGAFQSIGSTEPLPAMDGCNRLPFTPSIKVTPDGTEASKPMGLNVDVHVPQDLVLNPTGLSESEVRDITVALPEGVAINPSGGDGLEACPESLIGYKGQAESALEPGVENPVFPSNIPGGPGESVPLLPGTNFCPNASKIGTVAIRTPLLPNALEGAVYLASQEANPFGSLIAMYLVAQDPVSGTVVVLPGVVHLTETGQIVSTFEDNPQLPFEDAELHFFGGERAPLASPVYCGAYTTSAQYTPWSGAGTVHASSTFNITSGPSSAASPQGTPCPGRTLPFDPTSTGGATNIQAGAYSPFTTTFSRAPGEQNVQSAEVKLPAGVLGALPGVELCREPQAGLGECGAASEIGETTVSVGVGGDPFTVRGGRVYITGPYNGTRECTVGEPGCAPFGLSVVNPAKAGPFDVAATENNHPACDCILVRAKVEVDPITGALTITSNPPGTADSIPTIIEGIPLQIQHVNITTTRTDFQFNPTNCSKMKVEATLHSGEGGVDHLEVPFQVTNCATLAFKPQFKVSTSGKTSRSGGASLHVELAYPKAPFGTQANIRSVKVDLPKQLPSRLTTLQKACPARTFEANPAGCSADSIVGHATAITPLIPVPLTGPAYFVSYGGAKFPELVIVLQGYGVTLDLHGETFISKAGITSSTFHTVPDAPVGSFELTLPQGPDSALAANGDLCSQPLYMPTAFQAQNGASLHQNTLIETEGCPYSLQVRSERVRDHTLTLRVTVPVAGRLTAHAKGLHGRSMSSTRRSTLTLKLPESRAGRLRAKVLLSFTPKTGKQRKILRKSVTVTFG